MGGFADDCETLDEPPRNTWGSATGGAASCPQESGRQSTWQRRSRRCHGPAETKKAGAKSHRPSSSSHVTGTSTSVVRVQAMRALRAAIDSAPIVMPPHGNIQRTCRDNDGSKQAAPPMGRWRNNQWRVAGDRRGLPAEAEAPSAREDTRPWAERFGRNLGLPFWTPSTGTLCAPAS